MPTKSKPVTNVPGRRRLLKYVEGKNGKQIWYPNIENLIWWFTKNGWSFIQLGDRYSFIELSEAGQWATDYVPRRSFIKIGWGDQENHNFRGILFKNPKDAVIFRLKY